MTSYMVADTSLDIIHGSGAQFVETAGSSKPQIHKGSTERPVRRSSGSAMESAYVRNCVGRCSQSHSDDDYEECAVAIHVPPIKGTAQATFRVLNGTEAILSMPMLVANGNKVVFRGEDAMLITAKGETAPLMKVLINNSTEFLRIDVWTPCHVCPPSWVRSLSPDMKQREQCVVREQTGKKDCENSLKSMQSTGTREMGGIAISIESRRDGRYRAAQGPERPGQASVVRWKRYDAYPYSSGYERNVYS